MRIYTLTILLTVHSLHAAPLVYNMTLSSGKVLPVLPLALESNIVTVLVDGQTNRLYASKIRSLDLTIPEDLRETVYDKYPSALLTVAGTEKEVSVVRIASGLVEYIQEINIFSSSPDPIVRIHIRDIASMKFKWPDSVRTGTASVRGVPADVYQVIKAKAEREWPNDFEMQKYIIDKQMEAYRQLH
jgi:hypothetical protein